MSKTCIRKGEKMKSIAILMCSYNRKEKTLSAIEKIYSQQDFYNNKIQIYLLDDNSFDGTAEEVSMTFPQVNILKGSGNHYWNGGMNEAYKAAKVKDYDYYLWLNDDTFLYKDAISTLLNTYADLKSKLENYPLIVIGTTKDTRGIVSYGGVKKVSTLKPLSFELINPEKSPNTINECDTFNGNIVLIDKEAYNKLNNLDEVFIHGMGDFDFGLRAKRLGIKSCVTNSTLGICDKNSKKGTYLDPDISLIQGYKRLFSIKGLPVKQWFIFTKRHGEKMWLIYFIKPYIEFILIHMRKKIKNRKSKELSHD